jgi:oxygen-dependent protoporphyrinogen oxidase
MTMKDSDAARNRFIYYPDRLVKMPGPGQDIYSMLWSLFTEPVYKGLISGLIYDVRGEPRPKDLADESVGSFFNRRFGSHEFGDNILSAILHGIYAGDINQLSIKSLFPKFWDLERASHSLLTHGIKSMFGEKSDTVLNKVNPHGEGLIYSSSGKSILEASHYTFKGGISTLCNALEKALRAHPDVEFKMDLPVTGIENDAESNSIAVSSSGPLLCPG